jgi:hypothetical protein
MFNLHISGLTVVERLFYLNDPNGDSSDATSEMATMIQSLCETCSSMREVVTPKGSRFLLCQLSQTNPDYPKYPPQPVVRCDGYQEHKQAQEVER